MATCVLCRQLVVADDAWLILGPARVCCRACYEAEIAGQPVDWRRIGISLERVLWRAGAGR